MLVRAVSIVYANALVLPQLPTAQSLLFRLSPSLIEADDVARLLKQKDTVTDC